MIAKLPGIPDLADWHKRVAKAMDDMERWAIEEKWSAHRTQETLNEPPLGQYTVPVLHIEAAEGELHITPVAIRAVRPEGRIEIEAWPTLNRVRLLETPDGWQIMTSSNVPLPGPFNKNIFIDVARHLMS